MVQKECCREALATQSRWSQPTASLHQQAEHLGPLAVRPHPSPSPPTFNTRRKEAGGRQHRWAASSAAQRSIQKRQNPQSWGPQESEGWLTGQCGMKSHRRCELRRGQGSNPHQLPPPPHPIDTGKTQPVGSSGLALSKHAHALPLAPMWASITLATASPARFSFLITKTTTTAVTQQSRKRLAGPAS